MSETQVFKVNELRVGSGAFVLEGEISNCRITSFKTKESENASLLKATLKDDTGEVLLIAFSNVANKHSHCLEKGNQVRVEGGEYILKDQEGCPPDVKLTMSSNVKVLKKGSIQTIPILECLDMSQKETYPISCILVSQGNLTESREKKVPMLCLQVADKSVDEPVDVTLFTKCAQTFSSSPIQNGESILLLVKPSMFKENKKFVSFETVKQDETEKGNDLKEWYSTKKEPFQQTLKRKHDSLQDGRVSLASLKDMDSRSRVSLKECILSYVSSESDTSNTGTERRAARLFDKESQIEATFYGEAAKKMSEKDVGKCVLCHGKTSLYQGVSINIFDTPLEASCEELSSWYSSREEDPPSLSERLI